jgi:hypothetical protein
MGKNGNSISSKAFTLPEAAINTKQLAANKDRITGIQRVAWPRPQSNGATNTLSGEMGCFMLIIVSFFSSYTKCRGKIVILQNRLNKYEEDNLHGIVLDCS